jgi:hypothetical protein
MNRFSSSRRHFLKQASNAGIACSAAATLPSFAHTLAAESRGQAAPAASTTTAARVFVDSRRTIAPLDRNLFGSFLEHLGRAIYEGVYDPGSKLADGNGFRKDVLNEIRQLGVPMVRYPGGTFTTGWTESDRKKIARGRSTRHGTPSSRTSSEPMNFWPGAKRLARSLSWG